MEVFAVNHALPFSKMLTFYRKEPFDLEASYGKNVNLPLKDGFIGKLKSIVEAKYVMMGSISKRRYDTAVLVLQKNLVHAGPAEGTKLHPQNNF